MLRRFKSSSGAMIASSGKYPLDYASEGKTLPSEWYLIEKILSAFQIDSAFHGVSHNPALSIAALVLPFRDVPSLIMLSALVLLSGMAAMAAAQGINPASACTTATALAYDYTLGTACYKGEVGEIVWEVC